MKKYLILFALILIQGCSSGGDDGPTATDSATVFQSFEAGVFTAGYTQTMNYTGSDSAGGTYRATYSETTQAESIFLGVPAIPVLGQLQLTNTATGAFVSTLSTSYWSTSASDRHYLGYSDSTTTTVSSTTTAIPETVKIGDFGDIGTYIDNAGNVETRSWRLDDGFNGNADIVRLSTITDQYGNLVVSSTSTTKIDTTGKTLSQTLVIYYSDSGITLSLNSN